MTVSDKVYDYFMKEWLKKKEEYGLKYGIRSFSAFVTKRLYDLMEAEKKEGREGIRQGSSAASKPAG